MIPSLISRLNSTALALVFPEICQICESHPATSKQGYVCDLCCRQLILTQPPWCTQCGLPVDCSDSPNNDCLNCTDADWQFQRARSIYVAKGLLRQIIHRYKYNQHEYFEPLLRSCCLAGTPLIHTDYVALIPIPLYPAKERERGFNQAERLAHYFSESSNIPVQTDLLRRMRFTESQTHLSRTQRKHNLRNAFRCQTKPVPGNYLLIDDVLTTGATASSAAQALKKAGAQCVDVLTLARALPF